jgi:hypothetical protein
MRFPELTREQMTGGQKKAWRALLTRRDSDFTVPPGAGSAGAST